MHRRSGLGVRTIELGMPCWLTVNKEPIRPRSVLEDGANRPPAAQRATPNAQRLKGCCPSRERSELMSTLIVRTIPRADPETIRVLGELGVATVHEALGRIGL